MSTDKKTELKNGNVLGLSADGTLLAYRPDLKKTVNDSGLRVTAEHIKILNETELSLALKDAHRLGLASEADLLEKRLEEIEAGDISPEKPAARELDVVIYGKAKVGKSTLAMVIARALDRAGIENITVYDDSSRRSLATKPGPEALKKHHINIATHPNYPTRGQQQIPGIASPSPFPGVIAYPMNRLKLPATVPEIHVKWDGSAKCYTAYCDATSHLIHYGATAAEAVAKAEAVARKALGLDKDK